MRQFSRFSLTLQLLALLIILPLCFAATAICTENAVDEQEYEYWQQKFPRVQIITQSDPATLYKEPGKPDNAAKFDVITAETCDVASGHVYARTHLFYKEYTLLNSTDGESEPWEHEIFHATPTRRCTTKKISTVFRNGMATYNYLLTDCEGSSYAAFFAQRYEKDDTLSGFQVEPRTGQLSYTITDDVAPYEVINKETNERKLHFANYNALVTRTLLFDENGWRFQTKADLSATEIAAMRKYIKTLSAEATPGDIKSIDENFDESTGKSSTDDANAYYDAHYGDELMKPAAKKRLEAAVRAVYLTALLDGDAQPLLPLLKQNMTHSYQPYAAELLAAIVGNIDAKHEVEFYAPDGIEDFKLIPHTVQSGDTMLELCRRYSTQLPVIERANPRLFHSNVIKLGEILQIPVPVSF